MPEADQFLQQLGFSEYESRAYIALLQQNPLNGYELAKLSGIPRANIYAVLQRLEDRKAVIRIDTEESCRYSPVYPDQLIPQMGSHFQNMLTDAQRALEAIAPPHEATLSRNILGYSDLLNQARHLIDTAQEEVFLALWHSESQALAEEVAHAAQRNIRLTTVCLQACRSECDKCRGSIYRYHLQPKQPVRWLIVAKDNREMVMGEIGPDESIALRTNQQSLVHMTLQYLQSNVAWAAVLENSGESFEQTLNPEALRILNSLDPEGAPSGWLTHMRNVLDKTR